MILAEVSVDGACAADLGPRERAMLASLVSPIRRATFVAGRAAARLAIERLLGSARGIEVLGAVGGPPEVSGAPVPLAVSITHACGIAIAVAGRCTRIGIDLVPHEESPRIARLAPRILGADCGSPMVSGQPLACWAATEAALKALRLGLLESGVLDGAPRVRVLSVVPPRLEPSSLSLRIDEHRLGVVAVAWSESSEERYTPPSTTIVAPLM